MKERVLSGVAVVAVLLATCVAMWLTPPLATVHAQTPTKAKVAPPAPSGPAPHLASGRIDFSGLWRPGDIF